MINNQKKAYISLLLITLILWVQLIPSYAMIETNKNTSSQTVTETVYGTVYENVYQDVVFNDNDIELDFEIADSAMHPTKPILYATDKENKKLYAVNLEAKESSSIKFNFMPESLTYANDEIYVSLLKGNHSYYWWEEDQEGAVAIIDSNDLTNIEQFDIETDPWDIEVSRDGYIFIPSGSGQWTDFYSYSRNFREKNKYRIRQQSYIKMHPIENKIYSITTDSSPRDIEAYKYDKGRIISSYDSPYHGDYSMSENFEISPDGKYILNGAGTVFRSTQSKQDDMLYEFKLDHSFNDIVFDLENNRFYIALSNKNIAMYDYNTFEQTGIYRTDKKIDRLFLNNNKLIALSRDSSKYILNTIELEDIESYPQMVGEYVYFDNTQCEDISFNENDIALDFDIADSTMHPTKSILYATDKENKKLYTINLEEKEASAIKFDDYIPESLTYANDEIYVSLLKRDHGYTWWAEDQEGVVAIIDSNNLKNIEQFYIETDPWDIEVSEDGYIFIPSGSGQWTNFYSYSRNFRERNKLTTRIHDKSYIKIHPIENKVYSITTNLSPRDMEAYKYENGKIISSYDSPYHGDYHMNENFEISPDGKYIFNGAGTVFRSSQSKYDDMRYVLSLNNSFNDIVFDLENDRFYMAFSNKDIGMYDYKTFEQIGIYKTNKKVDRLFLKNNELITLSKNDVGSILNTIQIKDIEPYSEKISKDNQIYPGGIIKDAIYDSKGDKAYAIDEVLNRLLVIDCTNNKLVDTINLQYKPSGLCFDQNKDKIYIVNKDENYLVSEIDLETKSIVRNLKYKANKDSRDFSHRHIINNLGKLYIVLGNWAPELLVFEEDTFKQCDYKTNIDCVGDIVFNSNKNNFYTWKQYGWSAGYAGTDIYKYEIDDLEFKKIDSTNLGYPELERDPFDDPIFLLEDKGILIGKKNMFNLNDLSDRIFYFDEAIYGVDKSHTYAIGENNIFSLDDLKAVASFDEKKENILFISDDGAIYGISNDKKSIYYAQVPIKIESDVTSKRIEQGEKSNLNIEVVNLNGSKESIKDNISYKSLNTDVATVDQYGTITGINVGSADIEVTYNNMKTKLNINVVISVKDININKNEIEIITGQSEPLIADVSPYNATNKDVVWSTTDSKIATVSENGVVTALTSGTAIIRAVSQDNPSYYAESTVIVKNPPVSDIMLDKSELELYEGKNEQLKAIITPQNARNKNVVWSSNNEDVAKVNEEGLVVALKEGSATIRVTSEDNNDYYAECKVTVKHKKKKHSSGNKHAYENNNVDLDQTEVTDKLIAESKIKANELAQKIEEKSVEEAKKDMQNLTSAFEVILKDEKINTNEISQITGKITTALEKFIEREEVTVSDANDILKSVVEKNIKQVVSNNKEGIGIETVKEDVKKLAQKIVEKAGKTEISAKVEENETTAKVTFEFKEITKAVQAVEAAKAEIVDTLESIELNDVAQNIEKTIIVEVPKAIKNKEEVNVELDADICSTLIEEQINVQIKNKEVTFSVTPEFLQSTEIKGSIEFVNKNVDEVIEKEIKLNPKDKFGVDLKPVGKLFDLEINKQDNTTGAKEKIEKFMNKPVLEISLNDIDTSYVDLNKLGVYVFDEEDKSWEFIKSKRIDNSLIFQAPHFSIYTVMEMDTDFVDIDDHWARETIEFMTANHIVKGYENNNFCPNKTITRAEFVTMLVNMLDLKGEVKSIYTDVNKDDWYYENIGLASLNGISADVLNGKFRPDENITREDMALMIIQSYKVLKGKELKGEQIEFSDSDKVSDYAIEAVNVAKYNNIICGYEDGTFRPKQEATRAEAVTMIKKLMDK